MTRYLSPRLAAFATVMLPVVALQSTAHAALTCGGANQSGARACFVDPAIDQGALCNDGSQPAFWVRPGSGTGAKTWLIWLEGGGQCTSQQSCAARAKGADAHLLTSEGFTAAPGAGVLSASPVINPILYNANTVLIHYCSSDDWSGGRNSHAAFNPADPATWQFQGRRIALAAIASLRELGPAFQKASHIVLGGSSAGGVGITVTANDIIPALPATVASIHVVNDAGFGIEIGQYDPAISSPYVYKGQPTAFTQLFEAGMALWSGRGDAKCDVDAQSPQARAACYSALVFNRGYIGVPSFIAESQLDSAQLSDELCPAEGGNCSVPHDPQSMQGQYAAAFGRTMAHDLMGAGAAATYAVYSPDSVMHTMLANGSEFSVKHPFPNARLSPQAVFDLWLAGDGRRRIVEIATSPGLAVTRH